MSNFLLIKRLRFQTSSTIKLQFNVKFSTDNPSRSSIEKFPSPPNPFIRPLMGVLRSFGGAFPPLASIALPPALFSVPARLDLIHRVVGWFRAGERHGLAASKGRGDVAGSNRKIHAQKGTGKARAGDAAAPHRRGGGASFGPHPRDFSFELPLKLRWLAFRSALSEKYRLNQLSVICPNSLKLETHKTGEMARKLDGFLRPDNRNRPRKMLILGLEPITSPNLRNFRLATQSLDGAQVDYIQVHQEELIKQRYKLKQHAKHPVTAYHLIKYHHICITPPAIDFYNSINDRM